MTTWDDLTPADFDRGKAPKYIRQNADAGQDALFATGTPTVPAKAAPVPEELPGQGAMFALEEASPAAAGHEPDPEPEQGAFDVCRRCGQPIRERPDTGQWVTMTSTNPECYGRRS